MPTPLPLLRSLCAMFACMAGEVAIGAEVSTTSGGLRFQATRAAADQRDSAEHALLQQNLGDASRVIENLRAEPLIPTDTGAISGALAVRQLLRQASGEQLAVLERLAEQQAQQAWERWRQQPNLQQLQDFCRRHGETATGRAGWTTLAVWLRDEGRWQLAASAWQQVLQHPHSPERLQAQARQGLEEATRYGDLSPVSDSLPPQGNRLTATPRWSKPHTFPPILAAPWEHWRRELRLYGAVTWPSMQPLVDDPRAVIVRTPTGIVSYDPHTGSEAWRSATEDWGWIERTPGQLENPTYRQPFLEQFGRLLAADSVWGRLSGDRQRVYAVQSPRQLLDLNAPPGLGAAPLSGDTATDPFNFLTANDRQTGLPVWKVGGNAAGPTYPLADQFFCGVPLVVDDLLYVVGQQRSELQLLALHAARGELLWKLTLGDVPRTLAADPARQRMACTPRFHQGLILCPTGTGALLAVDPLTRSIVWAQRYGVSPREALARPRGDNSTYLPDLWWDGWRAVELVVDGDHACLASPESNALHGFRISDGTRLWSQPQQRGLDIIGSVPQGIVVQEADAVRLHDWQTGAMRWRTLTGEAAGRGCVSAAQVLVPTLSGSVIAIDLANGKPTADDLPLRALGNLHTTSSGWVSVRFEGLDFWTDATEAWAQLQQQPPAITPESPAERQKQAKMALAAGQSTAAINLLSTTPETDAIPLLKLAAQAALRSTPEDWQHWLALIQPPGSPIPSADEVALLLPALTAALQQPDPAAGLQQTLDLLNVVPRQGEVTFSNPSRFVRPELALLAPLMDWSGQRAENQQQFMELLRTRWEAALASNDPFAIQKLTELWQPLPSAHQRLLSSGAAPFLGQSLLAVELRLLTAAGSPDPLIAAQAQTRLVQLLKESGFPVEAEEYIRQFTALQPEPHSLPSAPISEPSQAWSNRKPAIERTTERNHHVYYFPVPFDQDSSPFFDRLDMTIERQGNRIRFGGGGHAGTWEVPLPKPTTSPFRYLQQHAMAWGRGRVVMLRVGFELIGLAPVNEAGEPAAHVLWHLDTLGGTSLSPERLRLEVLPAIPGIRDEEYRILDPYGSVIAQVGPVRSEYLCYTDKRQLICIDLLTGIRRWSRWDLPQGTILGGDDEFITLWQPEARRLEWIRAFDGQTVGERPCDLQPEQLLRQSGRLAWVLEREPEPRLACVDLITGAVQWSEPRTAGSVAFVLDPAHLGVVTPSGDFRILQALTGHEIARSTINDVPAVVDRVVLARDAQQWYVALSERVPRQAGLQAAQLRSGYRAPFITGPLVAISRRTGTVTWQKPLVQEPFAGDQPKSAPVLLQVYKQPPADLQSGQLTDGVLKVIDKETGVALLDQRGPELIGYAAMSTDAGQSVVNLALERETIRLRYRPRPPEPAMPDWD